MNANTNDPASANNPVSMVECFMTITDPRMARRRLHNLGDILIIALCCYLCGGESFYDMEDFGYAKEAWFRTFLNLPNGIPSHDTFNRVFALLHPAAFNECFLRWTQGLRKAISEEIISLDGKALRRAVSEGGIPYIVSAWSSANGIVLGQLKVKEKSNEITAVPQLLELLMLKGCIVTLDAMGCQKAIVEKIVEGGADYVIALKGNQGKAHEEIRAFMEDAVLNTPDELGYCESTEKGHGRIETRRYWQSGRLDWFEDKAKWRNLESVSMVESVREIKGVQTCERRFFISSLPVNAAKIAHVSREHWGIENKLHWVLDVQFNEDQSRARMKNAAENLAILRHIALNILKKETTKRRGIKGKQNNAGWDMAYLLKLLAIEPQANAPEASR